MWISPVFLLPELLPHCTWWINLKGQFELVHLMNFEPHCAVKESGTIVF